MSSTYEWKDGQPIVVEFAITLTQPWASLMEWGAKVIETRGRRTNYRGWIAIHAAKGCPDECRALVYKEPFLTALRHRKDPLPFGAVVAVTRIIGCLRTDEFPGLTEPERSFGDYSAGRYGYLTEGVRRLRDPIPMRGAQTIPWRMPRTITEVDLV